MCITFQMPLVSRRGYEVIPIINCREFFEWFNAEKKTIFVTDDPFGKSTFQEMKCEDWSRYHDDMSCILRQNAPNVKVIFTSRTLIVQTKICQKLFPLMSQNVIDISHGPYNLTVVESDSFVEQCGLIVQGFRHPSLPLISKLCKNVSRTVTVYVIYY